MLNINFYEFVEKDLWTKTFVTNEENLNPDQQRDVRREILANLSSEAIDKVIGKGKLNYGTELGQTTFLEELSTTTGKIQGWVNATAAPILRDAGAIVAAGQIAAYAKNLTADNIVEQCSVLLGEKRMESLGIIAPAAEALNMTIPVVYKMPYKELLHNITDRVWMYCYETKHTPICKDQLVTWFRGNPDVAGVGMLTVFYIQVAIAIGMCKLPLLIYADKWWKWLWNDTYSYDEIMRPAPHRINSKLEAEKSFSFYGFFHRFLSRDHHYAAMGEFLNNYFDTSAMFLISLLVAGWMMITSKSFTQYELDTLLYGISLIFSALVPGIAAGVYYKPSRRYFKLFIALVTGIFYFTTVIYVKFMNISAELDSLCAPLMTAYPQRPVPLENFQDAWAIFIVAGLTSLIALILIVSQLILRHHDSKPESANLTPTHFKKIKLLLLIFFMLCCDFCAILCLWSLMRRRSRAREVAGAEYEDDQWSFGQILALFIWAPAAIDYAYVLLIGAKNAFASKVPHGYTVVVKREESPLEAEERKSEGEGGEKGVKVEVSRSDSRKL